MIFSKGTFTAEVTVSDLPTVCDECGDPIEADHILVRWASRTFCLECAFPTLIPKEQLEPE